MSHIRPPRNRKQLKVSGVAQSDLRHGSCSSYVAVRPRPCLVSLCLLGVLACGESAGPVEIRALDAEGAALPELVAFLDAPDSEILDGACPSSEAGGLECTGGALRAEHVSGGFSATVKVRGHEFATRAFQYSDLPEAGGVRVAELVVDGLVPFEQDDDLATGFEPEQGLDAFEALAEEVDTDLGPSLVVKFYIDGLDDSPHVYFQNTRAHPLHYEFVRNVLGKPMTLAEFEAATYTGKDRTAMAGTLLYYPTAQAMCPALGRTVEAPIALTFFPSDDLDPEQALLAHRLIEERLGFVSLTGGAHRLVYVPAGSLQEGQLAEATRLFASQGAAWMTREELHGNTSMQILNPGIAYGTLRLLSPEELDTTVVGYTDILLLTRLPNWLPVVGGTITEELQTPLAHVNVAARTRGTPNLALLGASDDDSVAPLIGKLVRFEVRDGGYTLEETTLEEAQAFWDSRNPDPMIPEHDDSLQGLPGFDELSFDDATRVGVKAANLAELSQLLGDGAPRGFAIPFSYYQAFMDSAQVTDLLCGEARVDCEEEGRSASICEQAYALCLPPGGEPEILQDHVARLLAEPSFSADAELREACLDAIRYHIGHVPVDPSFAASLEQRVSEVFGSARVRIRSSTNTEDLPNFSGAGLYRSVGAYASGQDAAASRIRKVWASVWSWRAFEERSFWNIDHFEVRMGCAVNQAFVDEEANGVLVTQNIADPTVAGMYVNVQLGEVSVTNPVSGALPEIFSIVPAPAGVQVARQRYSSLSPDVPILSQSEIVTLFLAANDVRQHFAPLYGVDPSTLALELEFKLTSPDRALVIKQARPYTPLTTAADSAATEPYR